MPASFPVLMGPARRPAQVRDLLALPDGFPKGSDCVLLIPTPCPCCWGVHLPCQPSCFCTSAGAKERPGAPGGPTLPHPTPRLTAKGRPLPASSILEWRRGEIVVSFYSPPTSAGFPIFTCCPVEKIWATVPIQIYTLSHLGDR